MICQRDGTHRTRSPHFLLIGLSLTKTCYCLVLIIKMRYIVIKEIVKYILSKLGWYATPIFYIIDH